MNKDLIGRWNDVIPPDGEVYHLGDFAWHKFQATEKIIKQLNGNIHLIIGNHCHRMSNDWDKFSSLFSSVQYQLLLQTEDNVQFLLNHCPFLEWSGMEKGVYHLYGHTHQDDLNDRKDIYYKIHPNALNVGVDNNMMNPFTYNDVINRINWQNKIKLNKK